MHTTASDNLRSIFSSILHPPPLIITTSSPIATVCTSLSSSVFVGEMTSTRKFQRSLLDKANPSELTRWSISGLIDIGPSITSENAAMFLEEVRTRLALQIGRLNTWKDEIGGQTSNEVSHSTTGSKVIKACNFPVSMSIKEHTYRMETTKSEKIKCLKCLQDLIQLHENTYMLPHEVLNGEGKAILHSFTAPNQHYVKEVFDQIESRHGSSVETLADAVISARSVEGLMAPLANTKLGSGLDMLNEDSIESFLHSRLLIQLLCEHYISLNKGKTTGAISLDADLVDVVEDAKQDANQICDANLGVCPEVIIQPADNNEITNYIARPLIRSWSHHAIVELSKNAMKSNVEKWKEEPLVTREPMPPAVNIKILRNADHLSIQVIDHGVGLDKEREQKAFLFASSSSQKRWDRLEEQQSYAAVREPLGSLGVGLPMSRMMLRVFGGDLDLVNRSDTSGCTATMKILCDDSITAEN